METKDTAKGNPWQRTSYANLIRYQPSGKYFARLRVRGKLIRRCLKTTSIAVAKLRLSDLEKSERQFAEHAANLEGGKMTFADALATFARPAQREHGAAGVV